MEEYRNSDLVVIFSFFEHFSIQELATWHFHYSMYWLGRENHKINAICFPSFHNGCNPACNFIKCDVDSGQENTYTGKFAKMVHQDFFGQNGGTGVPITLT